MKYRFEASDEIHTCDIEAVGDIPGKILESIFGKNPPCTFELIMMDDGVYVLRKCYKDLHIYQKKKPVVKKLKRRWHPSDNRVRKYFKYLKT